MVTRRKIAPRECIICGRPVLAGRRSDAKTCGPACARKRKLAYYKARSQTEAFKAGQRERMARRREDQPVAHLGGRTTGTVACIEAEDA